MDIREKRREKKLTDQKRQKFIKMLSSFTVTAVVATTALFLPAPPTAEFLALSTLGNAIYYETLVRDGESAIVDDSLKILLENALDSREASLDSGRDFGLFEDLTAGHEYTVSIVSNQGFGETTLAEQTIRVEDSPGGMIIGEELLTVIDPAVFEQTLSYHVFTFVHDPEGIYTQIRVMYGVSYSQGEAGVPQEPQSWEPATPGTTPGHYLLDGIFNYNLRVFVRLVADTATETDLLLDTYEFSTPLRFLTSLYVAEAHQDQLIFHFYPDFQTVEDAIFTLDLKRGDRVVDSRTITESPEIPPAQSMEEAVVLVFGGLGDRTEYAAVLRVEYLDPDSGIAVSQTLSESAVMTTPEWSGSPGWSWDDPQRLTVTYSFHDPEGILSGFQCTVHGLDAEGTILTWNYAVMEVTGAEGEWIATAIFLLSPAEAYEISIQATMTLSETIWYEWVTLVEAQKITME